MIHTRLRTGSRLSYVIMRKIKGPFGVSRVLSFPVMQCAPYSIVDAALSLNVATNIATLLRYIRDFIHFTLGPVASSLQGFLTAHRYPFKLSG